MMSLLQFRVFYFQCIGAEARVMCSSYSTAECHPPCETRSGTDRRCEKGCISIAWQNKNKQSCHPNEHEWVEFQNYFNLWYSDLKTAIYKSRGSQQLHCNSHISKYPPILFFPYSRPPSLISFTFKVSTLISVSLSFLTLYILLFIH